MPDDQIPELPAELTVLIRQPIRPIGSSYIQGVLIVNVDLNMAAVISPEPFLILVNPIIIGRTCLDQIRVGSCYVKKVPRLQKLHFRVFLKQAGFLAIKFVYVILLFLPVIHIIVIIGRHQIPPGAMSTRKVLGCHFWFRFSQNILF